MSSFADLQRAVQSTIAAKRIGKPVFVRFLLQGMDKPDTVLARLAQALAMVRAWLGQPIESIYALGTIETGQVALTLQGREGAAALVCYARGEPHGDGVDIMVLGNHGAIYHDAGMALSWDEPALIEERPDPKILASIERALRLGKPESFGVETRP